MWRRQAGSVRSGSERSGSKRNVSGAGIGGSEGSAPLANVPRESQDIETSEGTPAPQSAPPLHPDTQSAPPEHRAGQSTAENGRSETGPRTGVR